MQEIEIDGQRFECEITGDGFPVVAVNNVQVPLGMWPHRDDVAALQQHGFSLVAYRHLGTTADMVDLAADVGRLLDHLDLGEVALWGYSQGAMTAQELALARPDLVRGAALVATRCRLSAMDRFRYGIEDQITPDSDLGAFAVLLMQYGADALCDDDRWERSLAMQLAMPAPVSPDAEELRRRANVLGATYGDPSRAAALAETQVPCLVVAFGDDGNIPPSLNREVADAIPDAEYVEVARAGHSGGMTHRREVWEHVLPFLERVSRPRP